MKNQRVAIIGGGIVGLLAARSLLAEGWRVVLYEKGSLAAESSWAGGGILSPLYPWRYADAVSVLMRRSQRVYPVLCEQVRLASGIDPEWTRSGLLTLGIDDAATALSWAERYRVDVLGIGRDEARKLEPALATDLVGGLWFPGVAQVRNPRFTKAIIREITINGAELLENEEVMSISRSSGGMTVVSDRGAAEYDKVLLAAGAWSGEFLKGLGVKLQVEPVRGQMLVFRAEPDVLRRMVLFDNRYLIPRRDGHVLVGSTLETVGFNKAVTPQAHDELAAYAHRVVPALADAPVEKQWAGLRPGSPQGIPFISTVPDFPDVVVCAGHFRNGFVLGPASVELALDLLLERKASINPEPYGIVAGANEISGL